MKVILTQDVKSLGKKDEIVNVSDGYANNFLLPRKLAVPATSGSINEVRNKQQAAEDKKKRETEAARDMARALKDKEVVVRVKSGADGKLFGGVSTKEVAEELKKQYGFELDKKKLTLPEPVKSLGTYTVEAKLYPGVAAVFKLRVESV